MASDIDSLPLSYTKPYRPRITGDLVPRPRLLERLEQRRDRPLTLVAAPAGRHSAGGNGDADLEMLQEARFRLVIVHDDEEREYVVTAGAEKLLAAGEKGGWTMEA